MEWRLQEVRKRHVRLPSPPQDQVQTLNVPGEPRKPRKPRKLDPGLIRKALRVSVVRRRRVRPFPLFFRALYVLYRCHDAFMHRPRGHVKLVAVVARFQWKRAGRREEKKGGLLYTRLEEGKERPNRLCLAAALH